jgi:hypothetical protein
MRCVNEMHYIGSEMSATHVKLYVLSMTKNNGTEKTSVPLILVMENGTEFFSVPLFLVMENGTEFFSVRLFLVMESTYSFT